jgi:hypothetical protein
VVIPELAGEGAFGGGMAGDLVFHRVQLGAPFGVGLTLLLMAYYSLKKNS